MLRTIRDLISLLRNQRRGLCLSLLVSFLDGALIMVPLIIAYCMISAMPEFVPDVSAPLSRQMVFLYIVVMLACVLLRIVLRYLVLRLRSDAGYKAMCEKRIRLGEHVKQSCFGFLNEKNLGDIVSTITSDAAFLEIEGMGVVEKAAAGIPALVIGSCFLLCVEYRIFLLTALLFIPAWFAYKRLVATQDRLNINRQKVIGEVTEDAVEFVRGIHVLKSYQMEKSARMSGIRQTFERFSAFSIRAELSHFPPMIWFQVWFRLISTGMVFLSGLLFLREEIDFLALFLLAVSSFSLFQGVESMGIFSIFAKMTQQSIDRMKAIEDMPMMTDAASKPDIAGKPGIAGKADMAADRTDAADKTGGSAAPHVCKTAEEPERFDISYQNVAFAYGSSPVLRGVSFDVPEGTTTALVGLSGSGKTTIISLLARFWDIKHGCIRLGGRDIRSLPYEHLLKSLSFVFQDVILFQDTVLNNIRIGNPSASMDDVIEAAKRARCHDFIMQLEAGYETLLGESGTKLSGGEKQRLSIARAIIKDAPVVLLDEMTANMDVENGIEIQMALQELLENKTILMISHKLSAIKNADQILVLENGVISQRGTHKELVAKKGLYKRLWDIQCETEYWSI